MSSILVAYDLLRSVMPSFVEGNDKEDFYIINQDIRELLFRFACGGKIQRAGNACIRPLSDDEFAGSLEWSNIFTIKLIFYMITCTKALCDASHYMTTGACLPCPAGTFQPYALKDFCFHCPEGDTGPPRATSPASYFTPVAAICSGLGGLAGVVVCRRRTGKDGKEDKVTKDSNDGTTTEASDPQTFTNMAYSS